MSLPKLIGSALLALAAFVAAPALAQEPSLHEVYQATQSGNFSEAQRLMDQVLAAHPSSAKAHYVEAELLARQGRLANAQTELATAERLQPGLPFAKPEAVQELRQRLSAGRSLRPAASSGVAPASSSGLAPATSPGIPWGTVLLLLGLVGVVMLVMRAIRRRAAPAATYLPAGSNLQRYGPGVPGQPYAGGPVGAAGGMGSGILGGLATGAAIGAGMVAGEALAHRIGGGHSGNEAAGGLGGAQPMPDNMGGNDFGVADSSSWDDGFGVGGGDMGGGGDWS